MFNLPPVPEVFNSRHLTCVSCKEKFVISEGTTDKRRKIPSVTPNVSVRYEDDRQQLPIVPSPHSVQQPSSHRLPVDAKLNHLEINCPRCGTDNRNWLYLNNQPKKTIFDSLKIQFQRMPGIRLLATMAILLFILMIAFAYSNILSIVHVGVLAFTIPIAIGGTFWDLTHKWKKFRENKYLYSHKLATRNPDFVLQLRGIFLIFFFSFVIPLLFVSLLPRGFNFALAIVREAPETTVNETITNIEQLTNKRLDESRENLLVITKEMQALLTRMPANDLPQFEQELDAFSKELDFVVTDATKVIEQTIADGIIIIEAQREDEMASIATAKETTLTEFREDFLAELRYLIIWGGLLGIATLITVVISFSNLQKFIRRINAHLPLPIFHSVAGMSRLVTWEAKQALEIQGNLQHIQWMSVNRNEAGGLDLVGLFRDPPEFDIYGQVKGELVRAQKHTIHTDKWCRVMDAKIEDVMVPIPAGAPAGNMQMLIQSQHDAPANVRIRLPAR
ncbi:hypothetical protein MNBD_CHLOROFLEXI01-1442 [hydrothermal vent metagenome]|uniref:Uncharacterized protein n=1 Tax=hydrothermal vent metagenome TaxID=652676 RepID=A0A3B0USA5_9ZZZZ